MIHLRDHRIELAVGARRSVAGKPTAKRQPPSAGMPCAYASAMPLAYDCSKCPAYCCSYQEIELKDCDINRLAKHLELDRETFLERYTKPGDALPVLRHHRDELFGSVCVFLDRETRRCTVYEARPNVCRTYPDRPRCGYFDFLSWEREFQGDDASLPLSRWAWSPPTS